MQNQDELGLPLVVPGNFIFTTYYFLNLQTAQFLMTSFNP